MDEELRRLLQQVAAGDLDPAEAARRLDERGSGGPRTMAPPAPERAAGEAAVARLLVRVAGRNVRLLGDPAVSTVAVDGPHRLSRDGDAVVVSDAEAELRPESFAMSPPGGWGAGGRRGGEWPPGGWPPSGWPPGGWRALFGSERSMTVRVNPALTVDVEVSAGSLVAEGVSRLGRVRVTAGSARVQDAAEPLDLLVQAGSAVVLARPTGGRWTLRTESGSLRLRLLQGSDATVTGHASLGKVTVGSGGAASAAVGGGAAQVEVEAVMGSATVELP